MKKRNKNIKVALVHDYLIAFGGAERVLLVLSEMFPNASIYLSCVNKKGLGKHWSKFKNLNLKTSWFQKIPYAYKLISPLRFLLPFIWESFDFSEYDLVITSSAWAAPRAIITKPGTRHIDYCHTPPRYLYKYPTARDKNNILLKIYDAVISHFMRFYDYIAGQRPDKIIANSQEVAGRIKKFYRREAVVINPPIDFKKSEKNKSNQSYYLFINRLVSHKHPELAIKACQKLNKRLIIVGAGILENKVKKLVKYSPRIKYLGRVSDKRLWQLYGEAKALLYPVELEDFGMIPLEAASCGTPTIAYYSGGAKETVKSGETGIFFKTLSVESLSKAIKRFEEIRSIKPDVCKKWAGNFSKGKFEERIYGEI